MSPRKKDGFPFLVVIVAVGIFLSILEKHPEIGVIAILMFGMYIVYIYYKREKMKEEQGILAMCYRIEKEVSLFNSVKTGLEQAFHYRKELRLCEEMFKLYPASKEKFMHTYKEKKDIEIFIYEELLKYDINVCLDKISKLKTKNAKINNINKTIELIKGYKDNSFLKTDTVYEYTLYLKNMITSLETDDYVSKAEKFTLKGQHDKAEKLFLEAINIIKNDDVPDDLQTDSIKKIERMAKNAVLRKKEKNIETE